LQKRSLRMRELRQAAHLGLHQDSIPRLQRANVEDRIKLVCAVAQSSFGFGYFRHGEVRTQREANHRAGLYGRASHLRRSESDVRRVNHDGVEAVSYRLIA